MISWGTRMPTNIKILTMPPVLTLQPPLCTRQQVRARLFSVQSKLILHVFYQCNVRHVSQHHVLNSINIKILFIYQQFHALHEYVYHREPTYYHCHQSVPSQPWFCPTQMVKPTWHAPRKMPILPPGVCKWHQTKREHVLMPHSFRQQSCMNRILMVWHFSNYSVYTHHWSYVSSNPTQLAIQARDEDAMVSL